MSRSTALRIVGIAVFLIIVIILGVRLSREVIKEAAPPAQAPPAPTAPAVPSSAGWTPEMQKEVDAWMFSGEPVEGGCITVRDGGAPSAINPVIDSTNPDFFSENLVFDAFLNISADLQPLPAESASVEISDDHKVYTIHLSPKGKWQDGEPVTVDDIIFFYEMVRDPKNNAQAQLDNIADIDHLERVDRLTLKVHMKEPIAAGIWKAVLPAIPKHAFEAEMADFKKEGKPWDMALSKLTRHPIGNGRYRLVNWDQPDTLVFERWEDYPFTKPYLKRITLKVIPQEAVALNAMKTGEIDCIPRMNSEAFAQGTNDPQFRAVGRKILAPGMSYAAIFWNMDGSNPFFTDLRVRRGLAMAVDIQAIINTLGFGLPVQSNGIWAPAIWCYNPDVKLLPYDPDGARALLETAGWKDEDGDGVLEKDGRKFEFELLTYNSPALVNILAAVAEDWKKVGVTAVIRPLEWAAQHQRNQASDFQATYLAWGMGADPDYSYNTWHSSQYKVGRNYGKYANPQADALWVRGRTVFDFAERKKIYQQLQQIIYEDQPALFLYYLPIRFAVNRNIKGVRLSPRDPIVFYPGIFGWWIPKELQTCM